MLIGGSVALPLSFGRTLEGPSVAVADVMPGPVALEFQSSHPHPMMTSIDIKAIQREDLLSGNLMSMRKKSEFFVY